MFAYKNARKKTIGIICLCMMLLTGCAGTADTPENGTAGASDISGNSTSDIPGNNTAGAGQQEAAQTAEIRQIRVPIPESFKASTTTGLYLSAGYPDDMSNIYIYTIEKDAAFAETMQDGQQVFVENLKQAYQQQYEESPEITVLSYEQVQVADRNAYKIELSYTLRGQTYDQLEYVIDAERTYFVAFSQVGDHAWMDVFRSCAAGMYFVAEDQ